MKKYASYNQDESKHCKARIAAIHDKSHQVHIWMNIIVFLSY